MNSTQRISYPNIFGVQPSSDGFIFSTFNDRPSVGKEGDLVAFHAESEQIIVTSSDVAHCGQAVGQFSQT
jgi:hypothetical protein